MNFKLCKYCKAQIPVKAKKCQWCKQTQDVDVPMIVGLVCAIAIFLFIGFCFSDISDSNVAEENSTTAKSLETQEKTEYQDQYNNIDLPEKYKSNFINACTECGIIATDIKNVKKIENWSNGERYTFYYKGSTHSLYLEDDGKINSINFMQNNSIQLYKKGFTSLKYDDFDYTYADFTSLQYAAEQIVKMNLNYPDTANFDWWTTGKYARYYDYYVMTAEFSAKNAFGVSSRHNFRVDCQYIDGTPKLIYYELDGVAVVGAPQIPELKREEIKETQASGDSTIRIVDGKLGEYGKEEDFDGVKIIRYYLPNGKYTVTCQTRESGFYIETIQTHIEDGYKTATILEKYNFQSVDESYNVSIDDGECITLIINSQLNFKPNN